MEHKITIRNVQCSTFMSQSKMRQDYREKDDMAVDALTDRLLKKKKPKQELANNNGIIQSSGGPVVKIQGVSSARVGSVLNITNRKDGRVSQALVMGIGNETLTAALMESQNSNQIATQAYDKVEDTGLVASFPLGPGIMGRLLGATGKPLDGKGDLTKVIYSPCLDQKAPSVVARSPISSTIHTGIKQLDLFYPLGKGLRVAMLGPKRTGKTRLALEIIANQKAAPNQEQDVYCVYVCIGKSEREIGQIVHTLKQKGADEYCTVIATNQSDSLPLQYLAPFAGCTVSSFFRDNGMNSLLILDDMSAHTALYHDLQACCDEPLNSLSYVHAQFLDQAAQMSAEKGHGSQTIMCLAQTDRAGDDVAKVRNARSLENIESVVDHNLILDPQMAASRNVWPPIKCTKLIERPPARFQPPLFRRVRIKLFEFLVSNHRALQQSRFAESLGVDSEIHEEQVIDYAEKIQILLSQREGEKIEEAELIILAYAGTRNYLVHVEIHEMRQYKSELVNYVENEHSRVMEILRSLDIKNEIPESMEPLLEKIYVNFDKYFQKKKSK